MVRKMAKPRKKNKKQVKARVYIFCEGEKTEPSYIKEYIHTFHPACRRLKGAEQPVQIKNTNKNTAEQLVDVASRFKKTLDFKGDVVWVVYDRESPSKVADEVHQRAWQAAKRNNIEVAISNVCFEYWILLHYAATSITANSCADVTNNRQFKQFLNELGITSYDKGDLSIFRKIITRDYVTRATANAKRVNAQTMSSAFSADGELPYKLNPYTDFYKVLETIDEVANA